MEGYDSGPRPLPWPLRQPLAAIVTVEDDGDFPPSSFVWPTDPDERTMIPFWLSLNEYNILGSTIDVGSDIAFGEDALRVVWLWMRNFRIEVPVSTNKCCGPSITDRLNATAANNATAAQYTTNWFEYGETGLSVLAPSMTPSTTPQEQIDKVLCFGYEMFLMTIVDQAKGVKSLELSENRDIVQQLGIALSGLASAGGLALAAGGAATAIIAWIGGPWTLMGLALVGIGTAIASLFVTVDTAVLDDPDAFHDVLCTMRQNGMGNAPSIEMWNALLTPNDFAPGSNAEKLAAIVAPFLADLQFFIQFIMSMSTLYDAGIEEHLPECEVCIPDIACEGGEGSNFLASDGMWNPYLGRAEYVGTGGNRGWGPDASAPSRISIWRAVSPEPERMKFNTNGTMGGQIRVYSSTGGVIGSLLGSVTSHTLEPDGTYTWEIPTMTGAPEILIDAGGTASLPVTDRIRSTCWNYDV